MIGTWVKEEGFLKVAELGPLGEVPLLHRAPGLTEDLDDGEACLDTR